MRPARSFLLLKVVITVIIQLLLWLLFCVYEVSDFVTQAGKLTFFRKSVLRRKIYVVVFHSWFWILRLRRKIYVDRKNKLQNSGFRLLNGAGLEVSFLQASVIYVGRKNEFGKKRILKTASFFRVSQNSLRLKTTHQKHTEEDLRSHGARAQSRF